MVSVREEVSDWMVLLLCKSQKKIMSSSRVVIVKSNQFLLVNVHLAAKLAPYSMGCSISSILGRKVLFLATKTGTPFHFFLPKVAFFNPFRFWHDRSFYIRPRDLPPVETQGPRL